MNILGDETYDRLWIEVIEQTHFYVSTGECPLAECLFPYHTGIVNMRDLINDQLKEKE